MEELDANFQNILINYIINENLESLITCLNSSFQKQKIFIKLIEQLLNDSSSPNNKNNASILEKLNKLLPNIILQIGIPFCELFNEHPTIINYYLHLYFNDNPTSKNILLNYIDIFNFESIEINPADDLIEKLQMKVPESYYNIKNQRRKNKNEIETLYDEITSLFSNLSIRINIEDNFDKEIVNYFEFAIKEKLYLINEIEKENKYPKAIIEFFQEKINNLYNLFKNININKSIDDKNINSNLNIKNKETNLTTSNNYSHSGFNINEILKNIREIPLKNRTSFYKDEQLVEGEDEFTEFKNYYLPLTEEKAEELKRQFCAFLNNKGGRLYLGINDQKVVKGVILNYKKCDSLRNLLVNYTYDFYPKCRLDKIKVYFIPIKSMKDNKFINDLYVVKIIVMQGDPFILYSMTNKGFKSAIRLQGQCANLTAEEITKEIIRRGKLGEQQKFDYSNYSNNQFNDPEPEKNYEDKSENNNDMQINNKNNNDDIISKNKIIKTYKRDIFVVEVKNIDNNLEVKHLYEQFRDCGSIYQKFFSKDGKSRGYGFLKFTSENSAVSAIKNFDNLKIGENKISLIMKK